MMKIYNILSTVILLTLLSACQSELQMATLQPERKITAKAIFTSDNETRAYITYGNPDKKNEIFKWNVKDYFYVFNLSKISNWKDYNLQLEIQDSSDINGNNAIFESVGELTPEIRIEKGDKVLVIFGGEARRVQPTAGYFDERNIYTVNVGTEANSPQYIVSNPDEDCLTYMSENLRMYDIVTAVEDDNLPDLHFKHLSAIMRVTIQNETGKDLYPTKLEFKYPTISPTAIEGDAVNRNPSFFNTTLYFSVETDENNEHYLKIYDTDEFFKSSKPYTEEVGTTINGKEGTADSGESIENGKSYELYITTVPRIGNDSFGKQFTIDLIENHQTKTPYSITIDNFNTVIEPGKRYWFDLVATPDHKLMFKSQYNPNDYKTSDSSGEENKEENGGDSTPKD